VFTGRTNMGSTTTVTVGTGGLGLLIFDGVAGHSVSLLTSAPAFNGACTLQLYTPITRPWELVLRALLPLLLIRSNMER
jgi:hypothetical protein